VGGGDEKKKGDWKSLIYESQQMDIDALFTVGGFVMFLMNDQLFKLRCRKYIIMCCSIHQSGPPL
jgi:hypothetical protein